MVVVVTNLAFMAWLPHLGRRENQSVPPVVIQGSTMPTPRNVPDPQITTYSRPEAFSDRAPVLSPAVDMRPVKGFDVPSTPLTRLSDEPGADSNQ